MYSRLSSTLSLLPVVFLLFRSCASQGPPAPSLDSLILDYCPASTNNSWWRPLELNGQDPCELGHQLIQHGVHFGCCSVEGVSPRSGDRNNEVEGCTSCNLPTYNIAVACFACNRYPTATTEDLKTAIATQNFSIPTVQQWEAANEFQSQTIVEPIPLPPWVSVPVVNSVFNIEGIVQNASESSLLANPPVSPPIVSVTPPSPVSPTDGQMTFIPGNTPTNTSNPQANLKASTNSASRVGSIAGGVLGAVLALALIALAAVYLIRRRRRMHIAPSAEFMPVVVTGAKPMMSSNGSPLPFAPGMWNSPVLEKVHSASTTEREFTPFTPGALSKVHTWDYDPERF